MNMESKFARDKYVRISDIFYSVLDKIWLLVIVGILITVLAFGALFINGKRVQNEEPSYMAAIEVYISSNEAISSRITYSDLVLSDPVLQQIIDEYDLDMTIEEVWNCIYTTAATDTNLIDISVISDDKETTEKIMDGIQKYSLPYIESSVQNASVAVVKNPSTIEKVKSEIPPQEYSTAYLSLKSVDTTAITDWGTYYENATSKTAMLKKSLIIAFAGAFLFAILLILITIFSRKLRYPEEFTETAGIPVLVTGAKDGSGLSYLANCTNKDTERNILLLFASKEGDGIDQVCQETAKGFEKLKKSVQIVTSKEVRDDEGILRGNSDVVIINAASIENSWDGFDMAKYADEIVLVTTPKALDDIQLNRIKDTLNRSNSSLSGICLNKVKVNQYGRKGRYLGTYHKN